MVEAEWAACTDPMAMLSFVRIRASERRLRLTTCAYCRLVWRWMDKASRKAVVLGERMADGPVEEGRRQAVVKAALGAVRRLVEEGGDFWMAADLAYRVPLDTVWEVVEWTIGNWCFPLAGGVPIIRDIFGNPFRPVALDPSRLSWHGGLLVSWPRGCTTATTLATCRSWPTPWKKRGTRTGTSSATAGRAASMTRGAR
jgi:hypothetical protein